MQTTSTLRGGTKSVQAWRLFIHSFSQKLDPPKENWGKCEGRGRSDGDGRQERSGGGKIRWGGSVDLLQKDKIQGSKEEKDSKK